MLANVMTYQPEHLETYDGFKPTGFDSHICSELDSFYIAPVSISRDASTLAQCNWDVVTEDILNRARHDETEIHRFGHWGCGWFEMLLIHPSDIDALKCADEWACSLEQYPIADEDKLSEREYEAACDYWERMSLSDRIDVCNRYDVSIFAARRDELPQDRTGELVSYLAE